MLREAKKYEGRRKTNEEGGRRITTTKMDEVPRRIKEKNDEIIITKDEKRRSMK